MSSDNAESTTITDTQPAQIKVHRDAWGQKELLETIVSRHFIVNSELGGTKWPVWKVDEQDNTDVHDSLDNLNVHLESLGWMAKLQYGEPWLVQVLPIPERQFPSSRTTIGFWSFSLITATIAGMLWIEDARPESGWFIESLFLDALVGYTLPVFAVIILASFLQKRHAEKYGLRVGHLTPIPDPSIALFSIALLPKSLLIWPFGILIIPSLPRMDARPWKNREMLGWSALIVPSVMVLVGIKLWIIGLLLTPDLIAIGSMQYVPEMPLIVNLLSPLIADGVSSKLVWAHPLAKAGSMLCFFGWVSLLPIPTFPGGRLLIARTSMSESRNSTNQLFLFAIILAFAWMFNAFGDFNIWLPVLGIMFPLLLLLGADRRIPIILDEPKSVNPDSVNRMGILLFVIFLLGLPGQTPYAMDDDWNEEIRYEFNEIVSIAEENQSWTGTFEILIVNSASITQDWRVELAEYNDMVSPNWDFTWLCNEDDYDSTLITGCGNEIPPNKASTVSLNIMWKSSQYSPVLELFYLISYVNDEPIISTIKLEPELPQYVNTSWYLNYQSDDVMRCIEVFTDGSETQYNVSFPNSESDFDYDTRMYWIDGYQGLEAELDEQTKEICIKGQDPIILLRSYVLNVIKLGNYSFQPALPELPLEFVTPENGTLIDSTNSRGWGSKIMSNSILSVSEQECQINLLAGTPTKPSDDSEQWVWNTNYRSSSRIPSIQENDSLLLILNDSDIASICSEEMYPIPDHTFSIEYGPELVFERNGNFYRMWTSLWASAANGELSGDNMSIFTIHNPNNHSTRINIVQTTYGDNADEWTIVKSTNQLVAGQNEFEFTPPGNLLSTLYVDFEDGEIYIYLGSYS